MALVGPDGHDRIDVAAGVAPAGDHHVVDVVDRQVRVQLVLAVQGRPDPGRRVARPEAVDAVAACAVRLVQVVAALDRGHLLVGGVGFEARLEETERSELVEPVDGDEQDHHDDREEADPTCVRRLADDLRGALGRQLDRAGRRRRREALDRCRLDRRPGHGETLLGLQLGAAVGRIGHRAWAIGSDIRCTRSGCAAG